jgi:hypothetical protein
MEVEKIEISPTPPVGSLGIIKKTSHSLLVE